MLVRKKEGRKGEGAAKKKSYKRDENPPGFLTD